jgi:hypothetical protein
LLDGVLFLLNGVLFLLYGVLLRCLSITPLMCYLIYILMHCTPLCCCQILP